MSVSRREVIKGAVAGVLFPGALTQVGGFGASGEGAGASYAYYGP